VDRKTARRYIAAAEAVSVVRDGGDGHMTDAVIGMVVEGGASALLRWPVRSAH
jgi:hypothetical protein